MLNNQVSRAQFLLVFIFFVLILTLSYAVPNELSASSSSISNMSTVVQGNDLSTWPSISADGRYVTFGSLATNLVSDDTNNTYDVFVHDRQTGETTRVSVASDGSQANNGANVPSISADGRYVAFESNATNLVNGEPNNLRDIYVHDRQTGETTRVSVASDDSQADNGSSWPSISADGRYVVFLSNATNLVSGDTNNTYDIFVHDRQTGETTRVSVASDGSQAYNGSYWPSISADGRYVAFPSNATNLVSGDTNNQKDIFVHDRQTGETTRVSVASDGSQANNTSDHPTISADGRYVTFHSWATNLVGGDTNNKVDIFVHDRQTGETTRVSVASDGTQADTESYLPSISADGRYVAFESFATNLVDNDTNNYPDIFVHDREAGDTTRVSIGTVTPTPQRQWTLMYYLAMDYPDFQGKYPTYERVLLNLSENENLHIVVFVDIFENWDNPEDESNPQIFHINKGNVNPIRKYGSEQSTGDPQMLADLLEAGFEYPAEYYGLVIFGHANGLIGIAPDKRPGNDNDCGKQDTKCLSFGEIADTLNDYPDLDLIELDGCSAGTIEAAYELRGQTSYLVASTYRKWSDPYNYPYDAVEINESTEPRSLAVQMANAYVSDKRDVTPAGTISVFDLSFADELKKDIDAFAVSLRNSMDNDQASRKKVVDIAEEVLRYAEDLDTVYDADLDDSLIDLGEFVSLIHDNFDDVEIQNKAINLLTTLESFVYYKDQWIDEDGGELEDKYCTPAPCKLDYRSERHSGVSIFFSYAKKHAYYNSQNFEFLLGEFADSNDISYAVASSGWGNFVNSYIDLNFPNAEIVEEPAPPVSVFPPLLKQYLPMIQTQ